jgi:hypothetical protein
LSFVIRLTGPGLLLRLALHGRVHGLLDECDRDTERRKGSCSRHRRVQAETEFPCHPVDLDVSGRFTPMKRVGARLAMRCHAT